jgi:FG-GAP-like repeat
MKRSIIEGCNLFALIVALALATSVDAATDFNADGKADLLWTQSSTGTVLLQTMSGPTVMTSNTVNVSSDWAVAGVGDFNGDGSADILWRQISTGTVIMQLMHGATVNSTNVINTFADWSVAAVADFNGDGSADILWKQASTGMVLMQLMNGPTAMASYSVNNNSDWIVAGVGDFNGDHNADILWRQVSTGAVLMQLMNGPNVVSNTYVNANADWSVTGVGDFNGDGKADILWRQGSTGVVIMQLMDGSTVLSSTLQNSNIDWVVAGVGDFDGDGKADILWRQISTGVVIMQLMDGPSVRSSTLINVSPSWSVSAPPGAIAGPAVPTACIASSSPPSLQVAGPVTLTMTCGGGATPLSYTWIGGQAQGMHGQQVSVSVAATTTFSAVAANAGGIASASVTVSVANVVAPSCSGFANTRVLDMNWSNPQEVVTTSVGGAGPNDAIVVRFTTGPETGQGSLPNQFGDIAGAEWQSVASNRAGALSTIPCDFDGGLSAGAVTSGTVPAVFFSVGPNGSGYFPGLEPNTTYYFNIRQTPGSDCTASGTCDMFFELHKPPGI